MILYVVPSLRECGPINQLFEIVKYLDKDATIVSLSPEPESSVCQEFENLGVSITVLGRASNPFYTLRKFKQAVSKYDPSLVHSHGFRPDFLTALAVQNRTTVSTVHNTPHRDYPLEYGRIGYLIAVFHHAIQYGIDCTVACSNSVQSATPGSDRVIQNGIDHNLYKSATKNCRDIRSDLGLKEDTTMYISVGRLIERKDPLTLIRGFIESRLSDESVLVLVGDGPLREKCEQESARSNQVHVKGYVESVLPYLQAADFFVSASVAEGLPLSVLEAMGCGLPVYLSDISPHQEILLTAEDGGRIFQKNSPVSFADVLSDPCNPDASDARRAIESHFNSKRMAEDYSLLYDRLLDS